MDQDHGKEKDAELIELAYRYLTEKTDPIGITENRKRAIRNKAKKFVVRDGELFYKKIQTGKVLPQY